MADPHNPYQTPPLGESGTPRLQAHLLRFLWKHRDRPPTIAGMIWDLTPNWLLVALTIFGVPWVFRLLAGPAPTWSVWTLCWGLFAGVVARDFGRVRRFVGVWQTYHRVLDWKTIEALVE